MEPVRESWTDARLDDLKNEVTRGFDRVDARFQQVDARFQHIEGRIDSLRGETRSGLDELGGRMDSLQRTMMGGTFATITALIVLIATQL
jgi:hypothetical protein